MPRPIKDADGYHVNFGDHRNGKRIRKTFSRKKYAKPYQAALEFIDTFSLEGQSPQTLLSECIPRYLKDVELKKMKRPSTIKTDLGRLNIFLKFCDLHKIKFLSQIDIFLLRKFHTYYLENAPFYSYKIINRTVDAAPVKTWRKYRYTISSFLNWSIDNDLIETNCIIGRKELISKGEIEETYPRWFEDNELDLIFNYFDDLGDLSLIAWFHLLTFAGLRRSEGIKLTWKKVILKNRIILIDDQTKSYCNRTIRLPEELCDSLYKLPKKNKFVFDNGRNEPRLDGDQYYRILKRCLRETNIDPAGAGLHTFRHTYGSNLAQGGAHPEEIKILMGHSTIKMAMQYVHFAPKHLDRAVSNFSYSRTPK